MQKSGGYRPLVLRGRGNLERPVLGRVARGQAPAQPDQIQVLDGHLEAFASGYAAYLFAAAAIPASLAAHLQAKGMPYLTGVGDLDTLRAGDVVEVYGGPAATVRVLCQAGSPENTLFLTNQCNCNCLICPDAEAMRQLSNPNGAARALALIGLMDPLTPALALTGGEPTLLVEDFLRILDACRRQLPQADYTLLTNGRLCCYRDFAALAAASQPERLIYALPLYGDTPELHDLTTASAGSFRQTTAGLANLLALGRKAEVRVVVSCLNFERLPALAQLIASHFPTVIRVNFMALELLGNAARHAGRVWVDFGAARPYVHQAAALLLARGVPVYFYNFPLCHLPPELWNLAVRSIASHKVRYADACAACGARERCGGFFYSTLGLMHIPVTPLAERWCQ